MDKETITREQAILINQAIELAGDQEPQFQFAQIPFEDKRNIPWPENIGLTGRRIICVCLQNSIMKALISKEQATDSLVKESYNKYIEKVQELKRLLIAEIGG